MTVEGKKVRGHAATVARRLPGATLSVYTRVHPRSATKPITVVALTPLLIRGPSEGRHTRLELSRCSTATARSNIHSFQIHNAGLLPTYKILELATDPPPILNPSSHMTFAY